jgi:hypothetical protein
MMWQPVMFIRPGANGLCLELPPERPLTRAAADQLEWRERENERMTRMLYRAQLADAFSDELARLQARYDRWLAGRG